MDTLGTALVLFLVGVACLVGGVYLAPSAAPALASNTSTSTLSADASTAYATAHTPSSFSQTGTLIFYPNNVGPVPYLVYTDANGRIATKALLLLRNSPNELSAWTGAHVFVTGNVVAEHVEVASISYVSAP